MKICKNCRKPLSYHESGFWFHTAHPRASNGKLEAGSAMCRVDDPRGYAGPGNEAIPMEESELIALILKRYDRD